MPLKVQIELKNVRIHRIAKTTAWFMLSAILFIAGWYLLTFLLTLRSGNVRIFPYPHEVIAAFLHLISHKIDGNSLLDHTIASLFRVIVGVLYASLIGVPLGLLLASSKRLNNLARPIVEILRPIPPIAWIPISMVVFGLGLIANAFIIFVGAFFPLLQNTYDGVNNQAKVYQDVARSLGASKTQVALEVIFPGIVPHLFTGLRISVGVGWMCVIAAEMMGLDVSTGGIGYFIQYMKNIGNYSYMMAGMLMIGFVGLAINWIFIALERSLLRWKE